MPIYEYACPACGRTFEKIERTQVDQAPCPMCGKIAGRVVSRPAAVGNNSASSPGCGNGGFS